jgi:branched-chain amino acid transport system substrate-binding protein
MVRKTLSVVAVAAFTTVGLSACSSSSNKPKAAGATATPYTIGFFVAETGPLAVPVRHNVIELAIQEINKLGGANGHPIQYKSYDVGSTGDPGAAVTAAQKAISDNVNAIIGPGFTGQVKAVGPVIAASGIPMLHSAQNPSIDFTKLGPAGQNVYRTWARADLYAQAMADYVADTLKPKKVGVTNSTDENSAYSGKAIIQELAKKGVTNVVHREGPLVPTDMTETVLAFKGTDVTFQWGVPNMDALFQKQMHANGEDQPTFASQSGGSLFTLNLNTPDELKNVTFIASCDADVLPTKEAKDFVAKYRAKYPDQSAKDTAGAAPTTYDQVFLFAQAANQAKSIAPAAVSAQLGKLSYTGVCGQYKADAEHNMAHFAQLVDETGGPLNKKLVKEFSNLTGVNVPVATTSTT